MKQALIFANRWCKLADRSTDLWIDFLDKKIDLATRNQKLEKIDKELKVIAQLLKATLQEGGET